MKNQEVLISEASVRNWLNQTVGQKCWTCFHGDHKCRNREEINMYCVALFPLWGCSCSHCMFFFSPKFKRKPKYQNKAAVLLVGPKTFPSLNCCSAWLGSFQSTSQCSHNLLTCAVCLKEKAKPTVFSSCAAGLSVLLHWFCKELWNYFLSYFDTLVSAFDSAEFLKNSLKFWIRHVRLH